MNPKEILRRSKNDLYFFCKYVLGLDKMQENPHKELCRFLQFQDEKERKLILMPRGSFKSSVVTVGHALFSLTKDPNLRILIAHELHKNAKKYVGEIRNHIESNARFKTIFGSWQQKGNWRDDEFTINARTIIKREPTVMAGSLERGVAVGLHFDVIFLDDVVSNNNTRTSDQIEKTIDYYKHLLSILDPGGKLYVVGTRWNINDLYGWILDKNNQESENWDVFIKKAYDDQGAPTMPKVLSPEFLAKMKITQGEKIFAHQYLNEATNSTLQTFDLKKIKIYDTIANPVHYFITVDSAISGKKGADYSAIIVNAVDYENNYYICEAYQGKHKPHDLLEKIFEFVIQYGPENIMGMGMETNALDQSIKSMIITEMGKRDFFIPMVDVKIDPRKRKEERIRWIDVKIQNGQLHIKKEHEDLLEQLRTHPQCKHDDLIDALKSQMKITFPCDQKPEQPLPNLSKIEQRRADEFKRIAKRRYVERKRWLEI